MWSIKCRRVVCGSGVTNTYSTNAIMSIIKTHGFLLEDQFFSQIWFRSLVHRVTVLLFVWVTTSALDSAGLYIIVINSYGPVTLKCVYPKSFLLIRINITYKGLFILSIINHSFHIIIYFNLRKIEISVWASGWCLQQDYTRPCLSAAY